MSKADNERPYARQGGWAILSGALVLLADQATKNWAVENLSTSCNNADSYCVDLPAGITLRLVFNTGAAFSTGTGLGPLLGVLAAGICAVLALMIWRATDRSQALVLGAILGGALGNLWDRAFRAEAGFLSGAVIDFIDLGWWPVFNLADVGIVGGVLALLLISMTQSDPGSTEEADPESAELNEQGVS